MARPAKRGGAARKPKGAPPAGRGPAARSGGSTRWTRWVAYGILGVFGLYWAVKSFGTHHLGNYAVETDFYWKYGPAARDLLHGRVDIANYDSKGWGYPAAVALLSLTGLDPFRAGQVLALLSALLAGWLLYRLHRSLLGPTLALLSLLLLLQNRTFLANTYEVGTDMFFFAVVLGSVALMLRSGAPGLPAILASGALGGWAFSTRYNGLFLWPGATLLFLVLQTPPGDRAVRWRRLLVWSGGFLAAAAPWLVINAVHTGNPLTNSNYVNVGYAVYGEGNWEKFFYGDRQIHSFADVIRLDPGRFAVAMGKNLVDHLRRDLSDLMPLLWGALAVVGGLLLARDRPGRRVGGYALLWGLYFLTLVPVFYGTRFSLPMLALYTGLAAWPFESGTAGRPFRSFEASVPIRAFVFLALWIPTSLSAYQWTEDLRNPERLSAGPYELEPAIGYLRLHGKGEALLARKPHAAFEAGMKFVPLPNVDSPAALHAEAEKAGARYLLISGAELSLRAAIRPFAEPGAQIPGFTLVFESPGALIYEVVPLGAGQTPP
jgi:hypothetical protein